MLTLYGADATVATDTAHSIVASSLRGIDSHGINLLPKIVGRVTSKKSSGEMLSQVAEPAELVVPGDGLPVGVVDAKLSPGQHACLFAARVCAEKAEQFGIGMVPVRNSTHFGSRSLIVRVDTILSESVASSSSSQPNWNAQSSDENLI